MLAHFFLLALLAFNISLCGMTKAPYVPKTTKERHLQIAAHAQLLKAARKGNLKKLKQLVTLPYVDVNITDDQGNSALHLVTGNREERVCAMINVLVDHGAGIHTQNKAGQTPLHSMAMKGSAQGVALLLNLGALPNQKDAQAHTPLFYSAVQPTDAFATLLEAGAPLDNNVAHTVGGDQNNLLHVAASAWAPELIPVISGHRVSLNAQNRRGQTPLHIAVKRGSIAALEALIKEKKALLDVADKAGNTPLHIAATLGDSKKIQILIGAGACLNPKNKAGVSPLDFEQVRSIAYSMLITAIQTKDDLSVQQLLEQRIDPNFPLQNALTMPTETQTPLSIAMTVRNAHAVCSLLDAGANPNQEDRFYDRVIVTPMGQHWWTAKDSICIKALKKNAADMAQLLITHIPKPLLVKHINEWIKRFTGTLICAKRMDKNLPSDVRKLLFKHCILSTLLPEQYTAARKICDYIPWDTQDMQHALPYKDKFDSARLAQYFRIWSAQINKVFLHKRKALLVL